MIINFICLPAHRVHHSCPHCGASEDIITWGNGWMCSDCGYEWDTPHSEN